MAQDGPQVIFYAYPTSPMWMKMNNILLLRRIPFSLVDVSDMLPRPQLLQLGITYRRIPVMCIGNDVFIDTALMIAELERRFTPEQGHPSLYSQHAGVEHLTMQYYADGALFPLAATFIPGHLLKPEFKKDRAQFNPKANFDANAKAQPLFLSQIRSQIMQIEKQLARSSTPFLLSTESPSLVDIAIFTEFNWAIRLRGAASVLVLPSSKAPPAYRKTMEWVETIRAALDKATKDTSNPASKPKKLTGDEAASITLKAGRTGEVLGRKLAIDASEPLIVAGWVKEGDVVEVTPTDTGRVPQVGKLVGIDAETLSIVASPEGGKGEFVMHFPRLGYGVKRTKGEAKL